MDPILRDIREIEFSWIDYNTQNDDYFSMIGGEIPLLLSAPHGAKHLRDDAWKEEDEYTSSLAIKLGELTGAFVIYVKNKTQEDSNHLFTTKYKVAIKKLLEEKEIKFLADLHGADEVRNYKVNIGIIDKNDMKKCSCPTLKPIIEECFKGFQEPLFNLDLFTAGPPRTVTSFAKNVCRVEAAQFEINGRNRIVERKPDSARARKGAGANFKAEEADVLEMIRRLEKMIIKITQNS